MASRVTVVKDETAKTVAVMADITKELNLFVGIPADSARDSDDDSEQISNAKLGYIHEFGAPEVNIPARPFLVPGFEKAQAKAVNLVEQAVKYSLNGQKFAAKALAYAAAEHILSKVQQEFYSNAWPPLKPRTIKNRHKQRGNKHPNDAEKNYARLVKGGMSPGQAQSVAGIMPLMNTLQLYNALTFQVGNEGEYQLS